MSEPRAWTHQPMSSNVLHTQASLQLRKSFQTTLSSRTVPLTCVIFGSKHFAPLFHIVWHSSVSGRNQNSRFVSSGVVLTELLHQQISYLVYDSPSPCFPLLIMLPAASPPLMITRESDVECISPLSLPVQSLNCRVVVRQLLARHTKEEIRKLIEEEYTSMSASTFIR